MSKIILTTLEELSAIVDMAVRRGMDAALRDMAGKTGLGKVGHMGTTLHQAGKQAHREKNQMGGSVTGRASSIMQEHLENARLNKDEDA